MKIRTLIFSLFLAPLMIFAKNADQVNRVKWEESKEDGTWQGKLGDDWVVSASSRNNNGVSEVQMVTFPGTDKKITIFAEKDDESKKFQHSVKVPKDFPFDVQVEASTKDGGIAITITFDDHSFWIIFTDTNRNLVGINNLP